MPQTVKLEAVKPGDTLHLHEPWADCLPAGPHKVYQHNSGELFVHCTCGTHMLDGHKQEDGTLLAFYKDPAPDLVPEEGEKSAA